ncbi:MAG: hypothetical protein MI747_09675 [Desulfobacterales bacterium]|nr:hypothetical protein [Desulfobacterales bacterium]
MELLSELQSRLTAYQKEYERLEKAGYGGQTLRADLEKLKGQVAALLSELKVIGKKVQAAERPVFVRSVALDSITTRNEITRVQPDEPFALLFTVGNLPAEAAKEMRYHMEVDNTDTGENLDDIASGLRWKYEEKKGTTLLLKQFPKGLPTTGYYDFRLFIDSSEMGTARSERVYIEVGPEYDSLNVHLPAEIKENEPVSIGCTLPDDYVAPFSMRIVNMAQEARIKNSFRELEWFDCTRDPGSMEHLFISMENGYSGRMVEGLRELPVHVTFRHTGTSQLQITITDAAGKQARGEVPLTVSGVPHALDAIWLVDEKGNEFNTIRAGDYVGLKAEYTRGTGTEGPPILHVSAHDGESGDLIVEKTMTPIRSPLQLDYRDFSWLGASSIVFTVQLENKDGKVLDEKRRELGVDRESLEISAPAIITAGSEIPIKLRLPHGFTPPITWVRTTHDDSVGIWSRRTEEGSHVMVGTAGVLYGFKNAAPTDAEISIAVKDDRGRVAVGTTKVFVTPFQELPTPTAIDATDSEIPPSDGGIELANMEPLTASTESDDGSGLVTADQKRKMARLCAAPPLAPPSENYRDGSAAYGSERLITRYLQNEDSPLRGRPTMTLISGGDGCSVDIVLTPTGEGHYAIWRGNEESVWRCSDMRCLGEFMDAEHKSISAENIRMWGNPDNITLSD